MITRSFVGGLALAGAYFGALTVLFRWFASSTGSHVLVIDSSIRKDVPRSCCYWRCGFRFTAIAGVSAGLLIGEATALAYFAGLFVPGVQCEVGWLPISGCTLDVAGAAPIPGTATVILSSTMVGLAAVNRFCANSPYQPFAILVLGVAAFGAATDLIVAIDRPASPQLCFRLIGALQWTAAAGFALGTLILPVGSLTAAIRSVLAHTGAALVRILGALSMLTIWPYLPPASAVAMLVLLLVPGVATALTGAVALSLVEASE